ncbi:protein of unknown function (plasmid) [Cupriavidus taiwanensis]|nr:protein of unknown function [Cupriavidus taiwanensis]
MADSAVRAGSRDDAGRPAADRLNPQLASDIGLGPLLGEGHLFAGALQLGRELGTQLRQLRATGHCENWIRSAPRAKKASAPPRTCEFCKILDKGYANRRREASVCTILFLLVARQLVVSKAPGTILCQGILQNIVPPADVLSNFVPLPTARSVAGRRATACEAGNGCRPELPRITVPSRGHADGVEGGYRHSSPHLNRLPTRTYWERERSRNGPRHITHCTPRPLPPAY